MAEDRVRLRQGLAVEFDDGDVSGGVKAVGGGHEGGFDLLWEFVEGVADVGEGYAGVEEEEAQDLASAFGQEVEVVDLGDAADFVVGGAGLADLGCCWHAWAGF